MDVIKFLFKNRIQEKNIGEEIAKNEQNRKMKIDDLEYLQKEYSEENKILLEFHKLKNEIIQDNMSKVINREILDDYFSLFIEQSLELGEEQILESEMLKEESFNRNLIKFFCMFLKYDITGILSNRSLVLVDKKGRSDDETLKCLMAVRESLNFQKKGKTPVLDPIEKIKEYPHFLEKENSYHSDKILGKLYDKIKICCEKQIKILQENDFGLSLRTDFEKKQNLILFIGFEIFIKFAWDFHCKYYEQLFYLLKNYDLENEFEFFINVKSTVLNYNFNRKYENDNYEAMGKLGRDQSFLINESRKFFILNTCKIVAYFLKNFGSSYDCILDLEEHNISRLFEAIQTKEYECVEENIYSKIFNICRNVTYIKRDYFMRNRKFADFEEVKKKIENNLHVIYFGFIKNFEEVNIKLLYENVKKALLTSIYYCCYFCFYKNFDLNVSQFVLNHKIFHSYKKYLKDQFKKIMMSHQNKNIYHDEINKKMNNLHSDYSSYSKNNFFSFPWILDIKLLLEIQSSNEKY